MVARSEIMKDNIKYFGQRTGDIVLHSLDKQNSLLFLKGDVFKGTKITQIQDTQISNLISHVMGLLPMNDDSVDRSQYPNVSIFNKPKLNLQFTIDSFDQPSDLNKIKFLSSEGIKINTDYFPMDSVSEMTTIATGATPNVHGIIGSNWFTPIGERVEAFTLKTQSLLANVADVLSQSFGGRSLVISLSSSNKIASANAVHPNIHAWKAPHFNIHTSKSTGSLVSGYFNPSQIKEADQLFLSHNKIESIIYTKEFSKFALPSGWKLSLHSGIVSVSDNQGKSVNFSLDKLQDIAFLSELVGLFNTVKLMKTDAYFNKLTQDASPDFVSIAFSSVSGLAAESDKYQSVLALINHAMEQTYSTLSGIYGGRVACQVIAMAPQQSIEPTLRSKISNIVGEHVHQESSLPHIYIKSKSLIHSSDLCTQVKDAVGASHPNTAVFCLPTVEHARVDDDDKPNGSGSGSSSGSLSPPNPNANATAEQADDNQIAAFQIFLFFPIFWVFFIIGGVLLMMKISSDAQKFDTLLYRSTERHH
eukprot:gene2153-2652_t